MVKQKQPTKPERIQVPAFWISKTQSAFGYEFLEKSQLDKNTLKGERSLIIRQSLTAGLSLHNLDPKLIDLINGYGKHLTFKNLIALLQMLDPDMQVPHTRQEKKVTLDGEQKFTVQELKTFVSVLEANKGTEIDVGALSTNDVAALDIEPAKSNFVERTDTESRGPASDQPSPVDSVVSRIDEPERTIGRTEYVAKGAEQQTASSNVKAEETAEVSQRAKKNKFINSLTQ